MAKAIPTAQIDSQVVDILTTSSPVNANILQDMDVFSMFMHADIVVQMVILSLLLASFWSWTISIDKFRKFRILEKRIKKFEKNIWQSKSLEKYYEEIKNTADSPTAKVFVAGMYEWMRLKGDSPQDVDDSQQSLELSNPKPSANDYARRGEIKQRIAHATNSVINREVAELEKNLGFLATVGSSAPFIGLFGTVWGIMASFQAIAQTQNSSLAVVAPGIAEALFATAIGLFAAIPAVIFYNKFTSQANIITEKIEEFSDEFASVIANELDKI